MAKKMNRVVETPSSLTINGRHILDVTNVSVHKSDDPLDPYREISVSFITNDYRFRSENRLENKLANRLRSQRYAFRKQFRFKSFLKARFNKLSKILSPCRG